MLPLEPSAEASGVVGLPAAGSTGAGPGSVALLGFAESKDKLVANKFPVIYREIPELGHQYFDAVTLRELIRWIDSLDRQ